MIHRLRHALLIALVLTACCRSRTAEPDVSRNDLPRIPPTEPAKALATFHVKKGFRIELTAAEPLVVDPIAMSFDENGRLFVVEMRDYSERRNETPHLGRIRMLEDTDGDGRFDRSTVYVDDLPWPTAVFCYGGGIFVGATPDILYCKDTNGDGVADVREAVFTGFASDYAPYQTNRLNVQALLNSFNWGLDNRIHGATSLSGGKVHLADNEFTRSWVKRERERGTSPSVPGAGDESISKRTSLRGRDFSFDPRTLDFRAESGGGQHGLSFNSAGRKFVCSNSSHIQTLMYEERYAGRNPDYSLPRALADIAADGPAAEVYRISPDEPWRVIRTKWRVAGLAAGPIEGGGRPSGYFTGATGISIYRGDAFPEEYQENAFVADCGSNLVHRKKIFPVGNGVELVARRPDDELKVEFLASTDNWFRPVQMANAPDGALYIADMYREVIEHPWSLPDSIKKHLDLNSGNDRGRIYRVVPDGFKQPRLPRLSSATTKTLVELLASANGWHRDTAARLLYERQDKSAVPLLEKMARHSMSSLARMHALFALDGLGALSDKSLMRALDDSSGGVRRAGILLYEKDFNSPSATSNPLWDKLKALAEDSDPAVTCQLAFTLGDVSRADRNRALAEIARRSGSNTWAQIAVLSSLKSGAGEIFAQLSGDARFRTSPETRPFLRELCVLIGAQKDSLAVQKVLDAASQSQDRGLTFDLVAALGEGLQRAGGSLTRADAGGAVNDIRERAKTVAPDAAAAEPERIRAIGLLAMMAGPESSAMLLSLIETNQSEAIRVAALQGLTRTADASAAGGLLQRWSGLSPGLRTGALTFLLTRADTTKTLLDAVRRGEVARADFSAMQLQTLRSHSNDAIRKMTLELFGEPAAATRQEVVGAFFPALNLHGDPTHGKAVFVERCASCHRLGGEGFALGPDLVSVRTSGRESLLVNILDPNRQVAPSYLNYTVETRDGRTLSGLIANESATAITLRGPNGLENIVLRPNIDRLQTQGQSVMPEGLEAGMKMQDMADLLAWITTAE